MAFQDVVFLSCQPTFSTTFPKNCGRGPWGPPHALKLWLGQARICSLQNTFAPTKPLFISVECYEDHEDKVEVNQATLFWGYYRIENGGICLSVCLSQIKKQHHFIDQNSLWLY